MRPSAPAAAAIRSPCIQLCAMDAATGLCRGCGRTLDEIARWTAIGADERDRIMAGLGERLRKAGLKGAACDG